MSNSPTRLGALAGQWDVPDPDELIVLLQPEPEVERSFYEGGILSSEQDSSEDRPVSEYRDDDRE